MSGCAAASHARHCAECAAPWRAARPARHRPSDDFALIRRGLSGPGRTRSSRGSSEGASGAGTGPGRPGQWKRPRLAPSRAPRKGPATPRQWAPGKWSHPHHPCLSYPPSSRLLLCQRSPKQARPARPSESSGARPRFRTPGTIDRSGLPGDGRNARRRTRGAPTSPWSGPWMPRGTGRAGRARASRPGGRGASRPTVELATAPRSSVRRINGAALQQPSPAGLSLTLSFSLQSHHQQIPPSLSSGAIKHRTGFRLFGSHHQQIQGERAAIREIGRAHV